MVPRKTTLAALLGAMAITGVGAGSASAGSPPITGTEVSRFEESFSDEPFLVEQDTDFNHVVGRGSDGSRAFFDFHAHFTVNANGETSVEFSTTRMVCT